MSNYAQREQDFMKKFYLTGEEISEFKQLPRDLRILYMQSTMLKGSMEDRMDAMMHRMSKMKEESRKFRREIPRDSRRKLLVGKPMD